MKNKKAQFESLKNKIKSLYFKKILNIEKKKNVFKLFFEKQFENLNLENNSDKKEKQFIYINKINKINLTPNQVKKNTTIIRENKLNKNILQSNIVKNSSDNVKIINLNKENKIAPVENIVKNDYTINEGDKLNKYSTINEQNNKDNISIIKNNIENINPSIKIVSTPDEIKKINTESILNTEKLDIKSFYFPSKEELMKLKKTLVKENKNFNAVTNNTSINFIRNEVKKPINTKIDYINKKDSLYVLPGFYEGTGPLKQDTVARLHKNEVVLNANQVKKAKATTPDIIKNENSINLSKVNQYTEQNINETNINNKNTVNDSTTQNSVKIPNNDFSPDQPISEQDTTMRLDNASESISYDKTFSSIDKNLSVPIYLEVDIKNRSLPAWRATMG
jgi:hypothetical protein